ncbi:MAG: ABC transporter ATP-binding protein, partial [Clostridiales bacterium]|nr:ABC transporter ATP-binding protein [Clostridiales bacterium]
MKCNVCGAEVSLSDKKCNTCGSVVDKTASMKSAISNISSMASALRAKREMGNTRSDSDEVLTKVNSLDDLYTKDIEIAPADEEYSDGFDLNAFYQNSKDNEYKDEIEEPSDEIEEYQEDEEVETTDVQEENDAEEEDQDSEEEVEEDIRSEEELEAEEEEVEDVVDIKEQPAEEEVVSDPAEEEQTEVLSEETVSEDDDTVSDSGDEGEGIVIEFEDDTPSSHDEYIKQSDIVHYGENEEDAEGFAIGTIGDNSEITEDSNDTIVAEDNSPIAYGDEKTDNVPSPEDVPFTQLEEVKSSVSDVNPIVIADKDVVSIDGDSSDTVEKEDDSLKKSQKKKKEKVKYNKFCGVMAIILLIIGTLASATILLSHFVFQSIPSNAVTDFILEFLSDPDMLMYIILGTLGVYILALIFSVIQVFIK